ncbi:MAG: hypothetical protein K5925_04525 [Bacilli bacterium]|nr:hypothetical protein [Bacilli bacterium]
MKFELDDVFNKYLHMTYREKVEVAREMIGDMAPFLMKLDLGEEDRINFYISLVRLFAGADQKLSLEECKLFNDIFSIDLTLKEFSTLMVGNDEEFVTSMDKIIDMMDDEVKVAACSFGLVFLSVDRNINESERKVFERILA